MQLLAWLTVGALLIFGFQGWLNERENPNRALNDAPGEAILKINRGGHYVANGFINNQAVVFLVDTGASDVVIPQTVAERLKLERGYAHTASTAAGRIRVYDTKLGSVRIGGVERRSVDATINPYMTDEVVLLGMSFMRNLEVIHRDELLIIRQ